MVENSFRGKGSKGQVNAFINSIFVSALSCYVASRVMGYLFLDAFRILLLHLRIIILVNSWITLLRLGTNYCIRIDFLLKLHEHERMTIREIPENHDH